MLSQELELSLNSVFQDAREKRHEFITVEHLLAVLLDNPSAARVLRACGGNIEELRRGLNAFLEEDVPKLAAGSKIDTQPTIGFQRVIQRAVLHVQGVGKREVTGANVLIAIFGEKESKAVYFLYKQKISRFDVVNFVSHGVSKVSRKTRYKATSEQDKEDFISELVEILPQEENLKPKSTSVKLFISYSHLDIACLERLLVHLRPLERDRAIACWSDKKIRTGDKWRKEIQKNLSEAAIVILLVSADFLASDFIVNNELPPLLLKAEAEEAVRILPVILKPCGFLRDEALSSFQAINDPAIPLLGLSHIDQETLYNNIADVVMDEIRARNS